MLTAWSEDSAVVKICSMAATTCAGDASFNSSSTSATFSSVIGCSGSMSSSVVVDEISVVGVVVCGISVSCVGSDVGTLVSSGRVRGGTEEVRSVVLGRGKEGSVVDVSRIVVDVVVSGSGKTVVVVVDCSGKEVDELLVVV